jgi:hypothetical protein
LREKCNAILPPPSLKSSFIIVKKVVSFFSLCGTGEKENQKGEKESNELKEKRTTVVMNVCVCVNYCIIHDLTTPFYYF